MFSRYGIDFEETFSPVDMCIFRRFKHFWPALAVQKDMVVHQMDVVTAFLNGELDEEIYMQQPDRIPSVGKVSTVSTD